MAYIATKATYIGEEEVKDGNGKPIVDDNGNPVKRIKTDVDDVIFATGEVIVLIEEVNKGQHFDLSIEDKGSTYFAPTQIKIGDGMHSFRELNWLQTLDYNQVRNSIDKSVEEHTTNLSKTYTQFKQEVNTKIELQNQRISTFIDVDSKEILKNLIQDNYFSLSSNGVLSAFYDTSISTANNLKSFSIGSSNSFNNNATNQIGRDCMTFGTKNNTFGFNNYSFGYNNNINGAYVLTHGYQNTVTTNEKNKWTVCFGYKNEIKNENNNMVIGNSNSVENSNSFVFGGHNTSSNVYSVTMGYQNTVSGIYAVAIGLSNTSSYGSAIAMGQNNTSSGHCSVAMGCNNDAVKNYSVAIGCENTAFGEYSVAMGHHNTASGQYSVAMGGVNTASGQYSYAEGNNTTASKLCDHAEGYNTNASGGNSHAEGYNTITSAPGAHAEGSSTTASGYDAHAEGCHTTASGYYSHAEGYYTTASQYYSHAEGSSTVASGVCSHAEGLDTKASSDYQHVQGKYNVEDTENKFAFIIGNGTKNSARSNAFAIDWNGLIYLNNSSTGIDLTSEIGGVKEDLTNLRTEVDSIVISATGDGNTAAEVGQARVNADGVENSTLKQRLDADFNGLQNQISTTNTKIDNEVGGIKEDLVEIETEILSKTVNLYVDGYTEKESGYLATKNSTNLTSSSNYLTLKVRVKPNTTYTITHQRHWGAFFDKNGNNIGYIGGNSTDYYDYTVTSPKNAAYMWVVVPASEDLNTYMVVEGETMPATYVKGELALQKYIDIKTTTTPILNLHHTQYVVYDITNKTIQIPACSIIYKSKAFVLTSRTISLSDVSTVDECWVLIFDYDNTEIQPVRWKNTFEYPVVGVVYKNKIFLNGVLESQVQLTENGTIIGSNTNANAYISISDAQKVVYHYDTKKLVIPAPAFTVINNKGVSRANTIELDLSTILVSGACMIWCDETGEIYATSWKGDHRRNKGDYLVGIIYQRNVVIFGVKEEDIVVKDANVCFFGDSITAGVHTSKTYHMYWAEWGGFVCRNYGIGSTGFVHTYTGDSLTGNGDEGLGTTVAQTGSNTVLDVMQSLETIDRCVIFAGTNDFGGSEDITAFRIAVQDTLDYALSKTPYVLVITPIQRTNYKTQTNSIGKKLIDYTNVIKEECDSRGIYCVDGIDVPLNPDNTSYKSEFITDGLHPTVKGHTMLARKLYTDFLVSMCK